MGTRVPGEALGALKRSWAALAAAGLHCRRGIRRERGGRRGPSHGGKKKDEGRAMKAIDGRHFPIPLRWRGLEPTKASPTGWAGLTGFQRRKTGAFSIKIKQPLFWSFVEQKEKK